MAEAGPSFAVRATAGSLRDDHGDQQGVVLDHPWTDQGVVAAPATNGAQVLHLAVALCVLNDTYREARRLGVELRGVAVSAGGGFDAQWASTGIEYEVEVDSPAGPLALQSLATVVDEVAEVPRALRAGAVVRRAGS